MMKLRLLIAMALVAFVNLKSKAQQYNDFEEEYEMPIEIDLNNDDNIWQIGKPNKSIFSTAYSVPNALVTDTINTYPVNNQSSFYFKINMSTLWVGHPYFMLLWQQKMDCELGKDGGVIEVSYDTLQTWVNIFEDAIYQPVALGDLSSDSLSNGALGITQIDSTWQQVGFCWTDSNGSPVDEIYIRFTFFSDSVETNQEGWMLDNFEAYPTIVDALENLAKKKTNNLRLESFPNPSFGEEITITKEGVQIPQATIQIIDRRGVLVYDQRGMFMENSQINTSNLGAGLYTILLKDNSGKIIGIKQIILTR